MEKKLPPSEDWPVWSPKLSYQRIKKAETIEEIEYEIALLEQKDQLFTKYRPNATMQRRIRNMIFYAKGKLEIANQRNQQQEQS